MANLLSVRPVHSFQAPSCGSRFPRLRRRWGAERMWARTAVVLTAVLAQSLVLRSIDPLALLRARAAEAQAAPLAAASPTAPADDESEREPQKVIAAGQEEMLAAMVGQGATLPGQCAFESGDINRTWIKSTYKCPEGDVVFELRHPDKAPAGATRTAKFAIVLQSGSPPPGLVDGLASLIRSREAAFEWTVTVVKASEGPRPVKSRRFSVLLVIAIGLLAFAGLRQTLRRSRKS